MCLKRSACIKQIQIVRSFIRLELFTKFGSCFKFAVGSVPDLFLDLSWFYDFCLNLYPHCHYCTGFIELTWLSTPFQSDKSKLELNL